MPQLKHISVCCLLVVLVLVNNSAMYYYSVLPRIVFCKAAFCMVTHLKCKEIFLVYICKAQLSFRCSSVVSLWSKLDFCWEMLPLDAAFISLLFLRRHRLILIYEINTFWALENDRSAYLRMCSYVCITYWFSAWIMCSIRINGL